MFYLYLESVLLRPAPVENGGEVPDGVGGVGLHQALSLLLPALHHQVRVSFGKQRFLSAVLWIHIGFNEDPDPGPVRVRIQSFDDRKF
jgi:hypothetical protein